MSVDRDTVRRIARLARLEVPEDRLDALSGELSNILGWVEQLREVDTEGVAPMQAVASTAPHRRADVVTDGGVCEDVLANAPDRRGDFFAVPKVVE